MSGFSDAIARFHESASQARGLEDFGADDYSEALSVLCRSLDDDAKLTPTGRFAVEAMITDSLQARLLCEEGWRRHPEAAEARVERPLVVTGLPRTGTTALHHLMAQDSAVQSLEHWIQRSPKPRPPRSFWDADPDFAAAAERVQMMFERSPEMRAIHEIEADLPDECWNLFAQNFVHSGYEAHADVSRYAAWWAECDMTPVYRRHLRNVQLIGHREPERRWLFKDATHLFHPEALFAVYPDARIVQTHRDPVQSMASVCSLCWSARSSITDDPDPLAFGRSTLALWERSVYRMMDVREGRDPAMFYDVPFDQFVTDPFGTIQSIYTYFDLPYTGDADRAIRRFRDQNPKDKHGKHAYTLEQWGLDADEIRERFARYTTAYADAGAGAQTGERS